MGFMAPLQAIVVRNSYIGQNTCPNLPEARARQAFSLHSVYFVALPGGAGGGGDTNNGRDSLLARVHHGGSTIGMLDTVDEPICDGSDDDSTQIT